MSEEKQIEKMAWDLCAVPKHPSIKSCEQCGNKHCHAMYYAKRVYNADYRKQTNAEWIISSDGYYPYCSRCNHEPKNGVMTDYCPDCGAKMKGGE